ncbi:hypothetical protein CPB83DRAFT_890139 [Crepidotus variabilis]|uniref:DUF6532 domain-containing protein n=1 Tax=Crepidotus variabilis TaxID=179855 RepID=A0A9P6JV73_9AGAR|nr:hypothetical protein CPB83DRAFT_890139 [Crepidotus variabilis]
MAPTTERGRKAAETRSENIERERRNNKHLVRETEAQGGQKAKSMAYKNAVWKTASTKNATVLRRSKRVVEESEEDIVDNHKQRNKHVRKRVVADNNDNDDDKGDDESDEKQAKNAKHKEKRKPLKSRNHDTSSDSNSNMEKEDKSTVHCPMMRVSLTSEMRRNQSTYIVKNNLNGARSSDCEEEPSTMTLNKDTTQEICGAASPSPTAASPRPSPQPSPRANSPTSRRVDSPQPSCRADSPQAYAPQACKRAHRVLDSSDEENVPPPTAKRTKSNNSRKDGFLAERPTIAASKPRKEGTKKHHLTAKSSQSTPAQWSADVQIKPAVVRSDKKRKLTDQTFDIQAIVRHAIEKATAEILLRNNWPEENNCNVFSQTLLLNACRDTDIKNTYEVIGEVKKRIRADAPFTKAVCDLVVDRLSGLRMPAKTEAAKQLPLYNLGLGGDSGNEWQPDTKSTFTSRTLISTIREAYFSNARAVGFRYIDQFLSTVPDKPDEKKMPISLIALCLTGLYCCISEFEDGKKKELTFDATKFLAINRLFMNIFKKLQEERPLQAHTRFHEILNLVIGDSSAGSIEEIENNAYSVIDF